MKNRINAQPLAETYNNFSGHYIFSEGANETSGLSMPACYNETRPVQCPQNLAKGINPDTDFFNPDITPLPATKARRYSESPVINMNVVKVEKRPFSNQNLKETAACLSEIEMAICNYDVSMFQSASHSLIALFLKMKMNEASSLTGQLEQLAVENKIPELKNVLMKIKKIIAQAVLSF